ncbi:DUF3857 domain-containing transglutaminase family protein [Dyadobacter sp. CY261]|uniref:DUF3857 domain-containing transglutaminase family protein n=1 Tax=Dyadobacter sp. CY261 TaxID=2907203 RepID=UPI001F1D6908|nr:DUF3857 domain-containing transglutaminase family protein [Dyadobacter sp. CY261]MCF0072125.1 DUF3857 domain-containing transglutaminase family protein [Dyadobacter sp. CY261]
MKKLNACIGNILMAVAILFPLSVMGQADYSVAKINPALVKDADAVLRVDEVFWDIKSQAEAVRKTRLVVTIFNENGEEHYGTLGVGYDKFTKVIDISGTLYDENGKQVKKLKNADIEDYSNGIAGDDISDSRAKRASFGKKSYQYPYTIEYVQEVRTRNMMFYPNWTPEPEEGCAVEYSVFKIKTPAGFEFRYKEYNGAPAVKKSKDADGADIYEWISKDYVRPKTSDLYPLPGYDRTPMVEVAPADFEVQDYKGNFRTWEDFSRFYYTLNAGRDVLPANVQEEVKALVKDADTDREKIERIYKWMQGRSRYVSIQLGIGGWQTIDAATVARTGYGDCKALTNFTLAALKVAGVPACAALIRAGKEALIRPDFPMSRFNHVIACAFAGKDTVWLECTSPTTKPNFMGSFTGGRPALLVLPTGGKLVATPDYKAPQNVRRSVSSVKLNETGDGEIESRAVYTGLQHEPRISILQQASKEEQKKWLVSHINLPSMDLQGFELTEGQDKEPSVTEKLTLNVRNCATKTGTRLFVKPSLLSRSFGFPATSERTTDFYLPVSEYNFTDLDTVSYAVPANYKLETTLPAFQIASAFGNYELKTTFENNRLICTRKVVMNGGRYESKDFAAWVDFLKKIRKADRAQVVFVENKL